MKIGFNKYDNYKNCKVQINTAFVENLKSEVSRKQGY